MTFHMYRRPSSMRGGGQFFLLQSLLLVAAATAEATGISAFHPTPIPARSQLFPLLVRCRSRVLCVREARPEVWAGPNLGSWRRPGRVSPRPMMVSSSSSPAETLSMCDGLREIADNYDAFLLDQWGVMHDGKQAYEGAVDCMRELAARGKKVILISNSSKRVGTSLKKLDKMGFDSSKLLGLVTGGESGWVGLKERTARPFSELGTKVFLFGNGDDDDEYVGSAGLELAEVHHADFILARGMFTMQDSEDLMERTGEGKFEMWEQEALRSLQIAASSMLPMLVTNPDLVRPDGDDSPMPGRLASTYEQILASNMCGERIVHYVGKPHRLVYDECFAILEKAGVTDKSRVCGVGDSLLHDITGAKRNGIDSVFVADGIHAGGLGMAQAKAGQEVDEGRLKALLADMSMMAPVPPPTHVIPHFQW